MLFCSINKYRDYEYEFIMCKSIKVAIISDLHCSYQQDVSTDHLDTYLFSNALIGDENRKHPIRELIDKIKEEQLSCDYVLCPGDITNKLDVQGLITGFEDLKLIASKLKAKQLICTPGNHDVVFDVQKCDKFKERNEPVKFLNKEEYPTQNEELNNQFWDKHYCIYSDESVLFLCIDSTVNLTEKNNSISDKLIGDIEKDLNKCVGNKIRIAMTHYHPIRYTNPNYKKYPDKDSLENGEKMLEKLNEMGFDLFIHGHKHIPRIQRNNNGYIFCAGGFSAKGNIIDTEYHNSFHIMELNLENGMTKGLVRTWWYSLCSGWVTTDAGKYDFPSFTGFGATKNIDQIISEIESLFDKGETSCDFESVTMAVPDIKYLLPSEQDILENRLKNKGIYFCSSLRSGNTNKVFKNE